MVILVDTNIIIDALANREPYADDAKRIMEKCAAKDEILSTQFDDYTELVEGISKKLGGE